MRCSDAQPNAACPMAWAFHSTFWTNNQRVDPTVPTCSTRRAPATILMLIQQHLVIDHLAHCTSLAPPQGFAWSHQRRRPNAAVARARTRPCSSRCSVGRAVQRQRLPAVWPGVCGRRHLHGALCIHAGDARGWRLEVMRSHSGICLAQQLHCSLQRQAATRNDACLAAHSTVMCSSSFIRSCVLVTIFANASTRCMTVNTNCLLPPIAMRTDEFA